MIYKVRGYVVFRMGNEKVKKDRLFSVKKTISIAFAYVGILTGAGLASGRELVQYFISFGIAGIADVVIIAGLYMVFGKMILSLGSYYRAQNHSDVLSQVLHPVISHILDYSMMLSCFVLSFVMVAGAGSSIGQQFQIPFWIGSLLCASLILAVSYMDFNKVMGALGMFTPIILILILIGLTAIFAGPQIDWSKTIETAGNTDSSLPNIYVSVLNYFALLLYSKVDLIVDANVPMQKLLQNIHPVLGFCMAITIFGMIFNTGLHRNLTFSSFVDCVDS